MAVSRSRFRETFIEEMRQRIDVLKAVDNVNDHLHGRKRMEKEDIKVCELALKHALPALKQIDGLPQEINDNRLIIQVLKFSDANNERGSESARTEALLHGNAVQAGAQGEAVRVQRLVHGVQPEGDL